MITDIEKMAYFRKQILAQLEHGCSNAYCSITGKATGMHVNTSCRCKSQLSELMLELIILLDNHDGMQIKPALAEIEND